MSQNQKPRNSVGSHDSARNNVNIQEALWGLKIEDSPGVGNADYQSSPYPDRPGEPDCLYYLRTGVCGYGITCRFNHPSYPVKGSLFTGELPERIGQPDCGFYLKTGTCKYGPTCKYHHPRDRRGAGPVTFNVLGLPVRQDEKPCPYYMRNGSCKFGVACKFHHPHPASSGTILPVTGPSFYGSAASNGIPPPGLSYPGSLPAWSLPQMPYPVLPPAQGPQSYVPVLMPPSQAWNTYTAGSTPISNHNFPKRPGQPECRHFMNTGTCKYGSDCKYNHPNERTVQAGTNNIGPNDLPLRPDQAIYSNYSMYGVDESGKFDHHLAAYPYHYGFSMPALPIVDKSLVYYQRNMPADVSSEPSKSSKCVRLPKIVAETNELDSNKKISEVSNGEAGSPESSTPSTETPHDQHS